MRFGGAGATRFSYNTPSHSRAVQPGPGRRGAHDFARLDLPRIQPTQCGHLVLLLRAAGGRTVLQILPGVEPAQLGRAGAVSARAGTPAAPGGNRAKQGTTR